MQKELTAVAVYFILCNCIGVGTLLRPDDIHDPYSAWHSMFIAGEATVC
ncbi:MAG: hypothetical protein JWO48_3582 [Bryobacterales bacterium]|nr:hypothetical protein [Bryobacterales bacterium]